MKNYIEEFMQENRLNIGESFNVGEFARNPYFFDEKYRFRSRKEPLSQISADNVVELLTGEHKIEKIKPKTLMEQLKEQGFGWELGESGIVRKVPLASMMVDSHEYDRANQGNCFLTESEAEREAYRRQLEFEMQEWARENDCLSTHKNGWRVAECFNIYILGSVDYFRDKFADKINKYYKWGD